MIVTTEIMELKYLDSVCKSSDILQIGSRNMQNYPLLTECAKTKMPIMLKTLWEFFESWLGAAEIF